MISREPKFAENPGISRSRDPGRQTLLNIISELYTSIPFIWAQSQSIYNDIEAWPKMTLIDLC